MNIALRVPIIQKVSCLCRVAPAYRTYTEHAFRSCQIVQPDALASIQSQRSDVLILETREELTKLKKLKTVQKPVFYLVDQPEKAIDDIAEMLNANLSGFVLQEGIDIKAIVELDAKLLAEEKRLNIKELIRFMPIIKESDLDNCDEVAKLTRNVALVMTTSRYNDSGLTFSHVLLTAARANNLVPLFTHSNLTMDALAFIKVCKAAKDAGFEGMITRSEPQSIVAQQTFSIGRLELKMAEDILKHLDKGIRTYQRSVNHSSIEIGPAQKEWALRVIQNAALQNKPSGGQKYKSPVTKVRARGGSEILSDVKVGQKVASYIDITVDSGHLAVWETSFFTCQNVHTSDIFCQRMGFRQKLVPFNMALIMCVGGSVMRLSEKALFHLGTYNSVQHQPLYIGDTVSCYYVLEWIKPSGKNLEHDIACTRHEMLNQNGELVFSLQKRTMFKAGMFSRETIVDDVPKTNTSGPVSSVKQRVIDNYRPSDVTSATCDHDVDDLFGHRFVKTFGRSETGAISALFRANNDLHYDTIKYRDEDVLVPGPAVCFATMSNLLFDYGDILYEESISSYMLNRTNMGDMISTISCVLEKKDIKENPALEELTIKCFGVLNMDSEELEDLQMPDNLLRQNEIRPSEIEKSLAEACPSLYHRIACIETRKIIRQKFKI